jgi:heme/copper-type cytochrome/quinol oxidase subunit 2
MHEDKNGVLTHLHSLHPKHYAGFAAALNDRRAASVHVHVVIVVVIVVVVVVVIIVVVLVVHVDAVDAQNGAGRALFHGGKDL